MHGADRLHGVGSPVSRTAEAPTPDRISLFPTGLEEKQRAFQVAPDVRQIVCQGQTEHLRFFGRDHLAGRPVVNLRAKRGVESAVPIGPCPVRDVGRIKLRRGLAIRKVLHGDEERWKEPAEPLKTSAVASTVSMSAQNSMARRRKFSTGSGVTRASFHPGVRHDPPSNAPGSATGPN